jgi:glycerophosphoryl diester phosphodiesterase
MQRGAVYGAYVSRWARLKYLAQVIVSGLAIAVIVASSMLLLWFLFDAEGAERHTSGRHPSLFYRPLGQDLLDDYAQVFGVAHNSGDSLLATRRALRYGADIIEVDVVSFNGQLYAAHDPPIGVVAQRAFRGPRLIDVWRAASGADVIALDLKDSSPEFLAMVVAFLEEHDDRQVVVSSPSPVALHMLRDGAPHAVVVYSIGSQARLAALQDDPDLLALIDGVGIRESLITEESAEWLNEHDLLIFAWTVNSMARVNALVELGVDAITTDNLAILELLGGQERSEARLRQRE